jgi:hypothetical protein
MLWIFAWPNFVTGGFAPFVAPGFKPGTLCFQ